MSNSNSEISGWKVVGCLGICALGITGLSLGIYTVVATTSGVRGAVALHNQNNTAENQVAAIGQWNKGNADVLRDQQNIANYTVEFKDGDPQGFIITAKSACNDDVTKYNLLASEPLTSQWQPGSVPTQYDASTVCN